MGRQQEVVTISGKVGDLIFSTRKGECHVKKKSDPMFIITCFLPKYKLDKIDGN